MTKLLKLLSLLLSPALLAAVICTPETARAAPGDILFFDGFEDGTLPAWATTNAAISGGNNAAGWAGSGLWSAYTSNAAVTLTSPNINAAVPAAQLNIWVRRGADAFSENPETNENLVLEYQRADATWVQLATYLGSGTPGQIYQDSYMLPAAALHGALAVRLRQTAGSGFDFDYWHFDSVLITELAPAGPLLVGSCDFFENGLGNWTVNPTTGAAGISGATFSSPTMSLFTNGGIVSVTSNVVDTSSPTFGDLTLWIRRGADAFSEDPDGGENLVVEYLNDVGAWIALATFAGAGGPGQIFIRAYTLPAAGRHVNFQLRFRQTAGSGLPWDFWHVDNVCFALSNDPVLLVTKLSQVLTDPINGPVNPKAIPSAVILYTLGVTNVGPGPVDNDSLVINDALPADTALFVDTSGGDPITFVDGPTASGLVYTYATDVTFSNQVGGGPPFTYIPIPDAQGFDPAVTGMQVNPKGIMNGAGPFGNPSFNLQLRIRIE